MRGPWRAIRIVHRFLAPITLAALALLTGRPARAADTPLDIHELLKRQNAHLDSLLNPQSTLFDSTGLGSLADSLDRGGYAAVRHHRPDAYRGGRLGLDIRPGALGAYNRIEGARVGAGITPRYGRRLTLDLSGAYAFKTHRWGGEALLRASRRTREPEVEVGWSQLVVPFGPDATSPVSPFLSYLAGQDRQDYLRRNEYHATVRPFRGRRFSTGLTWFYHEDTREQARTSFSLLRPHGRPIELPNPQVDELITRGVEATAQGHFRDDLVSLQARAGVGGGGLGGDRDWSWQGAAATLRPVFYDGGVLSLTLSGLNTGGNPAVQDAAYLGGDATLRGYERLQFVGRRRLTARVEYALGLDLLARSRIPIVRSLHLQFIPFVDAGSTWGGGRGVAGSATSLDGEMKSSVGLGLKRDLWLPGAEAVRLDISHRNDGSADPWSFWFRFVHIE